MWFSESKSTLAPNTVKVCLIIRHVFIHKLIPKHQSDMTSEHLTFLLSVAARADVISEPQAGGMQITLSVQMTVACNFPNGWAAM